MKRCAIWCARGRQRCERCRRRGNICKAFCCVTTGFTTGLAPGPWHIDAGSPRCALIIRRSSSCCRDDEVCRRLMTTPGVGPVVALTYRATVDVPARFHKSKAVGAVFGLTCSKYQSGEIDRSGRISRCGDQMMRVMLYEAAQSMLRSKKWSWLKAWAMQIARRRGMKKAIVALARRLAVIMHRIWVDGTEFRWTREQATAAA